MGTECRVRRWAVARGCVLSILALVLAPCMAGCSPGDGNRPAQGNQGKGPSSAPGAASAALPGDSGFPAKAEELVALVASVAENLPDEWFVKDVQRGPVQPPGLAETDGFHVRMHKWPPNADDFGKGKFPEVEWWLVPSPQPATGIATTAPATQPALQIGSWHGMSVYARANDLCQWATWREDLAAVLQRHRPATRPATTQPGAVSAVGPMTWSMVHLNTSPDSGMPHGYHAFCLLRNRHGGKPVSLDVYMMWCPFSDIEGPDGLDFLVVTRPGGREIKALLPLWRFDSRSVPFRDGVLAIRGPNLEFRRGAEVRKVPLDWKRPVSEWKVSGPDDDLDPNVARAASDPQGIQIVLSPGRLRLAIVEAEMTDGSMHLDHPCVLHILDVSDLPGKAREMRRVPLRGFRIAEWRKDGIVIESMSLVGGQRPIAFDRPQQYLVDVDAPRILPLTAEAKDPARHFLAEVQNRLDDDGYGRSIGRDHPLDALERLGDASVAGALEEMAKRARSNDLREAILRTAKALREPPKAPARESGQEGVPR